MANRKRQPGTTYPMTSSSPVFLLVFLSTLLTCKGTVYMNVSPYPARVYENAPAGVPVLTVDAYDDRTGQAVTEFRLEERGLSDYFTITDSGLMLTAKTIDRILGFKFQFFVFAVSTTAGSANWKHVIIEVTKKNLYPPEFSRPSYMFSVYRFAPLGTLMGTITATDRDEDAHNSHFTIYAPPRQPHLEYLNVTSSGDVILSKMPPDGLTPLNLLVLAVDDGMPPKTGTATAVIIVQDVNQPSTFCLSTSESKTTLCWKNPMPGRHDYGYNVIVEGPNLVLHKHVNGDGNKDEFCVSTSDLVIGQSYTFRVTLDIDDNITAAGAALTFEKRGEGSSMECQDKQFSICNYRNPCEHGAECLRVYDQQWTNYSCLCQPGYRGQNCSQEDICMLQPCLNGGQCVFRGHRLYDCECQPPEYYFGQVCQNYNVCKAEAPCQNGGVCRMLDNGTYSCACPEYFVGQNCSVRDPCSVSPCGNGGQCQKLTDIEHTCVCYPGYYGDRCDNVDRCLRDQPCRNGGFCVNTGNTTFSCTCPPDFTGSECETYNACLVVCKNNATCEMSHDGNYKCFCPPAFHGNECQHFNRCYNNPCHNGTCSTEDDTPLCRCDQGFHGTLCEKYNPCLTDPCNGHGDCLQLPPSSQQGHDGNSSFECRCYDAWWGERCQFANLCRLSVCLNGAECYNTPPNNFSCRCRPGFYENDCSKLNPCEADGGNSSLCQPGGVCINTTANSYRCECADGFHGNNCELTDPCFSSPCLNNGACVLNSGNGQYRCLCTEGYTGRQCEVVLSPCDSSKCGDGLLCRETGPGRHICVCENGWDAPHCFPVCRSEETVPGKTGRYLWPEVVVGKTAMVTCPLGGVSNDSYALRTCLQDGENGTRWGDPQDEDCNEMGLLEASRRLQALKELTSNPTGLGASEVNNFTSILEELYVYTLMDHEVASVMMNVISNLADVNVSVTVSSSKENKTSERLVNLLDQYTADVNLTKGENVSIASPNFELIAISVLNTSSGVTFHPSVVAGNFTEELDVSITIPPEAFLNDSKQAASEGRMTRLQMIGHRKSQLFIPDGLRYNETVIAHQPVLAATVSGRRVVNLTSPVVYTIRNLQSDANYTCVFWDQINRTWSEVGVVTVIKSGNSTVCHSSHLTSFAVLLDPSPHYALAAIHETVLTFISYIGCAISLFCLILTIVTYGLFRSLNKDKSGKILLNLCVALLLLNTVFLANGLATSDSDGLAEDVTACTVVAVLLHYMLLASLAWMLVEAVEMYRALVTVFAKYAQCYMLKRCLIGWGLPLVIVAVTVGVDRDNYTTGGTFCFISRNSPAAYYGSLVTPACLVLAVNTVIFVMVTRVILKPRFQQQKQKEAEGVTPAQVRGAFTVMFLLGITWVFGPLAIQEAKIVFNYLFCILNSLQGFLIFVFRCLFNSEVRMCWLQLIKTGTLKKRRGPIRSNVYSDTSSKADAKSGTYNNGSHGSGFAGSNGSSTATKTTLRTSNGWHPKLNGFPSGQAMERRGTKFSTLEFYQNSADNTKRGLRNPISEDERYGDGNLDDVHGDPDIFPAMDLYETDQPVGERKPGTASYEEGCQGEGDVLDYYESIRTSRKGESGHVMGAVYVSKNKDGMADVTDGRQRTVSSGSWTSQGISEGQARL